MAIFVTAGQFAPQGLVGGGLGYAAVSALGGAHRR